MFVSAWQMAAHLVEGTGSAPKEAHFKCDVSLLMICDPLIVVRSKSKHETAEMIQMRLSEFEFEETLEGKTNWSESCLRSDGMNIGVELPDTPAAVDLRLPRHQAQHHSGS